MALTITACLAWYDEPPEALQACIASLAGTATRLVAFDGAWQHFPGGGPCSDPAQAETIRAACARAWIEPVIRAPEHIWESQVAKRDALMRAAAHRSDWLLVIDGDETLRCDSELAAALATADEDVAEVLLLRAHGDGKMAWPVRRLFRAAAGVGLEGGHRGYRAADGRWLKHLSGVDTEPALDLIGTVTIVHDSRLRGVRRDAAASAYYRARARLQLEAAA